MQRSSSWWVAFLVCLMPGFVAAQEAPARVAESMAMPEASPDAVLQELTDIEARIAELDRERARLGIGGPATLTAAGFLAGAAMGFFAFFVWFLDGAPDGFDERLSAEGRKVVRTLGLIALAGVAVGTGGVVWLARRLSARGELRRQRRPLDERKRQLQLMVSPPSGYQSGGLSMRLAF